MADRYVDWIEIYKDEAGDWRWTAWAGNGRKVADSGEGYANKVDLENAAREIFRDIEIRERETE